MSHRDTPYEFHDQIVQEVHVLYIATRIKATFSVNQNPQQTRLFSADNKRDIHFWK